MKTRLDIIVETVSQILEGKKGRERGDEGSVRFSKKRKKGKTEFPERKQMRGREADRSEYDYDGPRGRNED